VLYAAPAPSSTGSILLLVVDQCSMTWIGSMFIHSQRRIKSMQAGLAEKMMRGLSGSLLRHGLPVGRRHD